MHNHLYTNNYTMYISMYIGILLYTRNYMASFGAM